MANAADLGAVRTVVVGTDGSEPAAEAVAWALAEAHRRGLPLHAIAAWSASRDPQETQWLATMKSVSELRSALTDELAVAVRSTVERRGHHEVPISARVVYGDPAKALIDASDDERLLVVGSRGRGTLTGLILGSVSQACAQYSRGPVVIVRGSAPTDGIGRVVVGVDGSAESLLALQFAAAAARLRGAPLEVVHVWQDTDHAAHGRLLPLGASAKAQADREWQNILRATRSPPRMWRSSAVTCAGMRSRYCSRPPKELRCWWWGRGDAEVGRASCWDRCRCAASPCPLARWRWSVLNPAMSPGAKPGLQTERVRPQTALVPRRPP